MKEARSDALLNDIEHYPHAFVIACLRDWSDLSLGFAMRGMEEEDMPMYNTADLKVIFA